MKSVQELDLLTEAELYEELYKEAAGHCMGAAIGNREAASARTSSARIAMLETSVSSLQYLERVFLVARKKNGGQFPRGVDTIKKAAGGSSPDSCILLK